MGYASYHLIVNDYLTYGRLLGYLPIEDVENAPLSIEELDNITSVLIYSMTGQLLRTSETNKPDLQGLPTGIYTIVFRSDNSQTIQKIVIK